jgi:excisionase family DNA binding protein
MLFINLEICIAFISFILYISFMRIRISNNIYNNFNFFSLTLEMIMLADPVDTRLDEEPRLPTERESNLARESGRVLSLRMSSKSDANQICIVDEKGEQKSVTIPSSAYRLLIDILSEMSMGNAVNVTPIHAVLTTQEAANILNVSRPFFVKLIENGQIPFHKTGSHRRVYYKDLLEYKAKIDSERHRVLDQLSLEAQELNMGY